MRKKIITCVVVSTLFTSTVEVLATAIPSEETQVEIQVNNARLAQDVVVDGLYDNAVLYRGASLSIKGYVDEQATNQEVSWQITGNKDVIDLEASGNHATITGKTSGTVWVMARATDGSDRAREYAVNVSDYPGDQASQSLIGKDIIPILKRPFGGSTTILRVEVNKSLTSSKQREEALKAYLRKLTSLGTLSNESVYSDNDYEYHVLDINDQKVEVRVPKNEGNLKNILVDVDQYNGEQTEFEENENPVPPLPDTIVSEEIEKPVIEEVLSPKIPVDEVTQGIENIIIVGGTGTSSDDPIIVALEGSLTVQEKIATMERYLTALQRSKKLGFIRKADQTDFTSYIFQVSPKLSVGRSVSPTTKNDFFIEIRVSKDDEEAYIPIIEMLDDLDQQRVEVTAETDEVEEIKEVAQLEEELIEMPYKEQQLINKERHEQEATLKEQEKKDIDEKDTDEKDTKNVSIMMIMLLGLVVGIKKIV